MAHSPFVRWLPVAGCAERAPLLLVHGHTSSKGTWSKIGQRLADVVRTAVYAIDLRGHGEHPIPPTADYSMDSVMRDIVQFISEHALGRVNVLGHSMGGRIVACLAAAHPDVVQSVIIEDMDTRPRQAPTKPEEEVEQLRVFEQRRIGKSAARAAAMDLGYPAERVDGWIESDRIVKMEREKDDEESAWHIGIHPYTTYHALHQLLGDAAMERAFRALAQDSHSRIAAQLLVADPRKGSAVRQETLREMESILPRMEVEQIKGSGHSIHRTHDKEFLRLVQSFLERNG